MQSNSSQRETVVTPGRDIVASTATAFKDELRHAVEGGADKLVIDLKGVDTVDSLGIQVIASAYNSMKKTGGFMTVTNATQDIRNLFQALKLDEDFDVCCAN